MDQQTAGWEVEAGDLGGLGRQVEPQPADIVTRSSLLLAVHQDLLLARRGPPLEEEGPLAGRAQLGELSVGERRDDVVSPADLLLGEGLPPRSSLGFLFPEHGSGDVDEYEDYQK